MRPDDAGVAKHRRDAGEMNGDDEPDCGDESEPRRDEDIGREPQDSQIDDSAPVAHVHRALEEARLPFEPVPADGAGGIHREAASEHRALKTHGAALLQHGAEPCGGHYTLRMATSRPQLGVITFEEADE